MRTSRTAFFTPGAVTSGSHFRRGSGCFSGEDTTGARQHGAGLPLTDLKVKCSKDLRRTVGRRSLAPGARVIDKPHARRKRITSPAGYNGAPGARNQPYD